MVDVKEIEELVALMQRSGLSELSVESPDYKIKIKRGPEGPGSAAAGAEHPAHESPAERAGAENEEVVSVVSPVVGVFHNGGVGEAREPVQAGDRVREGQLLAAIEAMKVPHDVRASVAGVVAQVLVADGAAVAYGQRLFLIQLEEESEPSEVESAIGLA